METNNIAKLICGLQNGIILFVFDYFLFIFTVVEKDILNNNNNSIVTVVWNVKIIILLILYRVFAENSINFEKSGLKNIMNNIDV